MINRSASAIDPDLQKLFERSDEVFSAIHKLLTNCQAGDLEKLKELHEEGERIAREMADTIKPKATSTEGLYLALVS